MACRAEGEAAAGLLVRVAAASHVPRTAARLRPLPPTVAAQRGQGEGEGEALGALVGRGAAA